MPVPNTMQDLATLAGSNFPTGTESIGNSLDDYLRAHAAIIRSTNALASATIAAASTTNVGGADGEAVIITGAATITSLGTGFNGCRRELRFQGACLLTHSTNLQLPNSANITTANGDVMVFRCIASGQWVLVSSARAHPSIVGTLPITSGGTGATTASAALTNLGAVAKAGDTMTGALALSLGTFSSDYPLNVSGVLSGDARFIRLANTNTDANAFAYFRAEANGGQVHVGRAASSYAGVAAYTNRGVLECDGGSGDQVYSANNHFFYTNAGADLRGRVNGSGACFGTNVVSPDDLLQVSAVDGTNSGLRISHGSTFRGLIGSPGIASGYITGANVGDMCYRSGSTTMRWAVGSATQTMSLTNAGALTITGTGTGVNWVATSDENLKDIHGRYEADAYLADKLEMIDFTWLASGIRDKGVSAQQTRKVAAHYVHKGENGFLAVDKASLALEAVVGLAARVRELEAGK